MKAFYVLDVNHSDRITIDDIKHTYNAKQHPDVIQGKKTEDEILYDFLETFDTHHANSKDDIKDANVTPDEWIEYYNNVSISIDDDAYFEAMITKAWNLDNSHVTKKGWGGQY
jgi:calcyphosin